MKLKEIIEFLDSKIPEDLALDFDMIGFQGIYDLNQEITSVKILMDLLPQDDNFDENTLIITHHPPLFEPKTPTYTIHSNWDIITGGANEALAENLNLNVISVFDEETDIGRICECDCSFSELRETIRQNFKNSRIVNEPEEDIDLKRIGTISGFGLKNPEYLKMARKKNLDILISGDLTHDIAILAKFLNLTVIDLGHHESEVPGLYALKNIVDELDVDVEVINNSIINPL